MKTKLHIERRDCWFNWHQLQTIYGPDIRMQTTVCLLSKTNSTVVVSSTWSNWHHDISRLLEIHTLSVVGVGMGFPRGGIQMVPYCYLIDLTAAYAQRIVSHDTCDTLQLRSLAIIKLLLLHYRCLAVCMNTQAWSITVRDGCGAHSIPSRCGASQAYTFHDW